jgi:hypothetical protein
MKSIIRQEEELREALLNLERAREQERKLRIEYQGLLKCLQVLSGATDIEQMFSDWTFEK